MTHTIQDIPRLDEAEARRIVGKDAEPADAPPLTRLWKTRIDGKGVARTGSVASKPYIDDQGYKAVYVTWDDLPHRGPVTQRLDLCGDYIVGLE